jgi:hypothetical protein
MKKIIITILLVLAVCYAYAGWNIFEKKHDKFSFQGVDFSMTADQVYQILKDKGIKEKMETQKQYNERIKQDMMSLNPNEIVIVDCDQKLLKYDVEVNYYFNENTKILTDIIVSFNYDFNKSFDAYGCYREIFDGLKKKYGNEFTTKKTNDTTECDWKFSDLEIGLNFRDDEYPKFRDIMLSYARELTDKEKQLELKRLDDIKAKTAKEL